MAWLTRRRPRSGSGLLPVVVQDHASGDVLMLAWANEEALDATARTGLAHFWSRSRDELWQKGATSGNALHVVEMSTDCDEDAVLYRVNPTGPACHTGSRSCFDADHAAGGRQAGGRQAGGGGGDVTERREATRGAFDLRALGRLVESRRGADPASSYTARLLAGGSRRAAEKVVEESGELAAAALAGSDDEVRGEAADLLYHAIVLLETRGIALEEIERTLAARHHDGAPLAVTDAGREPNAG